MYFQKCWWFFETTNVYVLMDHPVYVNRRTKIYVIAGKIMYTAGYIILTHIMFSVS